MIEGFDPGVRSTRSSVKAVDCASRPWVFDPVTGAEFILLQVDRLAGVWTVRIRFEPGTVVPSHLHSGPVFAVTLAGSWGYPELGAICHAGDYLVEEAGTVHSLSVMGDEHTDVVFTIHGTITYFDEEWQVIRIEDWRTIVDEYLAGCERLGVEADVIGLLAGGPTSESR
jgi:quercetin dioxygenase-like cupin family protein